MKPLADFACLSRRCATKKGDAPTYELPLDSKNCPRCGSKKLRRLYNHIAVRVGRARHDNGDMRHTSSSMAARVDQLAEPAILDAERRKKKGIEAGRRWKHDNGMVRTVPMQGLGGALQQVYAAGGQQALAPGGLPMTKAVPGGERPEIIEQHMTGVPMRIEARDTEHRIVKRGGKLEVEKA